MANRWEYIPHAIHKAHYSSKVEPNGTTIFLYRFNIRSARFKSGPGLISK